VRQPVRGRLQQLVPLAIGLAAVVALVVAVDPRAFAAAVRGFSVWAVPAVMGLCLSYYLLQGVRWWYLLRAVGVRLSLRDAVLLNFAGQSTGLLPLGELSRAVLVTEVTGVPFGAVVATVTVQELIYTLVIVAAAVPGALERQAVISGIGSALAGTVLVFVILTVPAVFRAVMAVVRRLPGVRRIAAQAEELQRDTVLLLRRWDTLVGTVLSVAGALVAISLFWLVVYSLRPGLLSWNEAAYVYAVSHIVGAITFSPGGLGSFEASTVGLLATLGVDLGTAAAAAVLVRAGDKGLATLMGFGAYAMARRRFTFAHVDLFGPPEKAPARARVDPDEAVAPGFSGP